MRQFTYTVSDPNGIHARTAGLFSEEAVKFHCAVELALDGRKANAKRLLDIMSLHAKTGDTLTVTCEGPEEARAAAALEADIHRYF